MSLAWLGRFSIVFAVVATIATILVYGFLTPSGLWVEEERPCVCIINDVLDPPPENPAEMRIISP